MEGVGDDPSEVVGPDREGLELDFPGAVGSRGRFVSREVTGWQLHCAETEAGGAAWWPLYHRSGQMI